MKTFEDYVEELGVKHRSKQAFWHLVLSGAPALPAVRRGLSSPNGRVRAECTRVLDHLVDEESWPELIGMLDDDEAAVRTWAMHALACDRCKDNECRPDKRDVFPKALEALRNDDDPFVRAIAVEVVARWVYDDEHAEHALIDACANDPSPAVRKKASWFVPGGTVYEKNSPKVPRVTR